VEKFYGEINETSVQISDKVKKQVEKVLNTID
jgi:hypothetical protein